MEHIKIEWYKPDQSVLIYRFQKGWTWDEVDGSFKEAYILLETVNHKVDVIMDFTASSMLVPKGAFANAQRAFANKPHPNVRLTVLIGNAFISKMTEMVRNFLPKGLDQWDLLFASSLPQAETMINQRQEDSIRD